MIKINDSNNFLPELFELYPEQLINDPNANIVITEPIAFECRTDLKYKKVIVINSEITPSDYIFQPDVLYCLASSTTDFHTQSLHFQYWFLTTVRANLGYQPRSGEKYLADVLLGGWSPIRYLIVNRLKSSQLIDQCLVNLQSRPNNFGNPDQYDDPYYKSKQLDYLDIKGFESCYNNQTLFTMTPVDNQNCHIFWSHIIPENIYSQTSVSIVSETESLSSVFFFTEKTAKALLSARPFWLYSCQGSMEYLKKLGFKTFSPFIDETYDNIKNNNQRVNAMMNSFIEFANKNFSQRQEIIRQLHDVCLYNRNLLLNKHKWIDPLANKIFSV
jgi:hypothetical protein